jgi:hypothetical protein
VLLLCVALAMVPLVHDESGAAPDEGGKSFVAEDWDDDGNPSGRFDAHWESADGGDFRDGPQGVTANEAVAWARGQSAIVVVQTVDGDEYSAGTRNVEDIPRRWPAEGIAFAPRVLATHWKVAIRVPADGPLAASSGEPVRKLIAAASAITEAKLTTWDGGEPWVECVVEARSVLDAMRRVDEVLAAGGFYDRSAREGAGYETVTRVLGPAGPA